MTGKKIREMLARNIKTIRSQKKFSQAVLAEKAEISIPFLSSIECANKWPHPDTLAKIADALSVNVEELFGNKIQNDKTSATATTENQDENFTKEILKDMLDAQQETLNYLYKKYFTKTLQRNI